MTPYFLWEEKSKRRFRRVMGTVSVLLAGAAGWLLTYAIFFSPLNDLPCHQWHVTDPRCGMWTDTSPQKKCVNGDLYIYNVGLKENALECVGKPVGE